MTESGVSRRRSRLRRRTRARIRRALLTGLVVLAVLSTVVGWVGFRGWQARAHLVNAAGLARELSAQVVAGDIERARRTLAALQEQATAARGDTDDPVWWLGRHTPYAGDDLTAVREIAVAVDDLSRQAFPDLLRTDLATLIPRQGRLDVARLGALADTVIEADAAVRQARTRLDAVPTGNLIPQVRSALTALRTELDRLAALTGAADRGARVLPPLLGAAGPRNYLLVSQNLAELRATGGMFGAYVVIRAEGGRIEMVNQGKASDLQAFTPPVADLPAELRRRYGDLPATYAADVNLTPHFPTAASLYREMVRRRTGVTVDGVLAVDPVALSYLLTATGPVPVPDGPTLTSATAVRSLLSDAYRTMSPARQDEYFAASAAAVFDAFLSAKVSPKGVLSAFDRSITERRILFWSARKEERDILGESAIAGILPERETTPTVGVFLNDGSGAKLGYYLSPTVRLTSGGCRHDGRRELHLRFALHSSAPADGLPDSVLGLAKSGDPYTARTLVNVFSPAGGSLLRGSLDGRPIGLVSGQERRRQVATVNVEVPPGGTRTVEVDLLTGRNSAGAPDLWLTPTATPATTQIVPAPSCNQ
ncbi:DUF4012 domain-containing protein [Micromonospora sp. NPDC000089]|uniref:DUF4012 domain-containing protein n=1 Tax=unclassified Micromonospora TaxID=2617518 RepID=UPI0036AD1A0B